MFLRLVLVNPGEAPLGEPLDRRARRQDQEWMLGNNLLVAPVVRKGATSRAVDFPRGCWRAPASGPGYSGPRTATVPAPLTSRPH